MQLGGRTLSITNQFTCPKPGSPIGLSFISATATKILRTKPMALKFNFSVSI
ncbi:hypothetical protein Peur_070696 [Populus x canadensis]